MGGQTPNGVIDCTAAGIASIELHFYGNGELVQRYAFECRDGNAKITEIKGDQTLEVYAFAVDAVGVILFEGSEEIDIMAGEQIVDGKIIMVYADQNDGDAESSTSPADNNNTQPEDSTSDSDSPQETDPASDSELPSDTDVPSNAPDEDVTMDHFRNDLNMEFVQIPAGSFYMGSPANELGRDDDEMRHQVTLTRSFYMQTTEVTQQQWTVVMQSGNPSYFQACGGNCPVENISWNETQQFITALNRRYQGIYTFRLPTEAEWEYAARAGTDTAFENGNISAIGCNYDPNLNAIGWYCFNSEVDYSGSTDLSDRGGPQLAGTQEVALLPPNGFGLYDMHGNVWEKCQDYYGPYPSGPVVDYRGPDSGVERVVRGGSWVVNVNGCRSANRQSGTPDHRTAYTGFRLVCEPLN